MLHKNLSSHFGKFGRGRGNLCPIGTHYFTAEGLLLIGYLYHIYLAVQPEIGTGHGKRGAPLSGSGFRGNALQSLLLCIVGLGDGGIELVAAAGVVSFKFIINLGRRLQLLFQAVRSYQG